MRGLGRQTRERAKKWLLNVNGKGVAPPRAGVPGFYRACGPPPARPPSRRYPHVFASAWALAACAVVAWATSSTLGTPFLGLRSPWLLRALTPPKGSGRFATAHAALCAPVRLNRQLPPPCEPRRSVPEWLRRRSQLASPSQRYGERGVERGWHVPPPKLQAETLVQRQSLAPPPPLRLSALRGEWPPERAATMLAFANTTHHFAPTSVAIRLALGSSQTELWEAQFVAACPCGEALRARWQAALRYSAWQTCG